MKTFLKVLNLISWTMALVAAVMGDTTAANAMVATDDDKPARK
jgi:hypothetical protein